MLSNLTSNARVQHLFSSCARRFIQTLKNEQIEFSILCDTRIMRFDPPLSIELLQRIGKMSVFVLSGYSFESIRIFSHYFSFEAGLILENGKDVATLLHVPYVSIIQILIQDEEQSQSVPIFINPLESPQVQDLDDSFSAILSKNIDLIKREE